jgi:hypothetical protein
MKGEWTMLRQALVPTAVCVLLAAPAFAQGKVEVSGFCGWTISDGVGFDAAPVGGSVYTRADPMDGVSFGASLGVFITPQAEFEFAWGHRATTLDVSGTGPVRSGDMTIDNYHGHFVYNFGERETVVRPFVFAGLGATDYGDARFPAKVVAGMTRFTGSFGAGVKVFPSRHVGAKAMFRAVPTYVKSGGDGGWCDPSWGCTLVANAQYVNQFEFSGGVVLRF